jgi:SAM-dependent MidA family methyltransferase
MFGLSKQGEAESSSTLAEELSERISREDKITFHDWMNAALYHPTLGYYNRSDLKRWGREGDYRTSPERSELFAATFARYFVNLYERMGRPAKFTIVEMGAGNGKFAAGVLGKLQKDFPSAFDILDYVVVEASQDATRRTAEELNGFHGHVQFVDSLGIPVIQSGIVFSNELLDAFAVHRVKSIEGQLKELYVGLNASGQFVWLADDLSSEEVRRYCDANLPTLLDGQVVEVNLTIEGWLQLLAERFVNGYLVSVDYGAEANVLYNASVRREGTLRAFSSHEFVDDVLSAPGEYDITSTVNWTHVKAEGEKRGFAVDEFAPLDKFLMNGGVLDELERGLNMAVNEGARSSLTTAAREMILPGGMASSFQVLVQRKISE